MPYLNLDLNYFDHRKTRRLIGLLGRGAEVLPIRLWAYCGKFHCEDGRLTGYSEQEIESLAFWWGKTGIMLPAMQSSEWMDRDTAGWFMHDWKDHQGHLSAFKAKGKAMAEARWSKARDAASNAASNAAKAAQQCSDCTNQTNLTDCTNQTNNAPVDAVDPIPVLAPGSGLAFTVLKCEIGKAYDRSPIAHWSYEEEHLLASICRTPTAEAEWLEILAYHLKDPRYKRQSVLSLLGHWASELDKARSYERQKKQTGNKPDDRQRQEIINIKTL